MTYAARRRVVTPIVVALIALVLFAISSNRPALAVTTGQFASGWSVNNIADWTPPPPSTNPLGASNNACVGGTTGGAWAEFTFPGLGLPAADIVTGIEVQVDYRSTNTHTLQLRKGGANVGSSKVIAAVAPSFCSNTAVVTAGGAGDLWGTSLTTADFSAGSVSVRLTIGTPNLDLDSIQLIVHHSSGVDNPPVANAGGPYSGNEGAAIAVSGSGSTDDNGINTYEWDCVNDGTFEISSASSSANCTYSNDGSFTAALRVTDTIGQQDTDTATVTVANVLPTVGADNALVTVNEGDTAANTGTFSDPADSVTISASVGTVSQIGTQSGTWSWSWPTTDGPLDSQTVTITATDDDGSSTTMFSLTVNNVDPVLGPLSLSAAVIDEDDSVTLAGSFTDVGVLDTHTVSVDWGDGNVTSATVTQGSGSGTFTASHQYLDDNPTGTLSDVYTITVTVTDDDTGSDTDTTTITVNNVDPVITSLASSATFEDKVEEGESVTVSGAFTDVGTLDTHTAVVDWGDGNVTSATVIQGSGSGTFTADHAYVSGGVYTVTVTVTDDDTGFDMETTLAVVTGVGINGGVLQVVGTSGDDHVDVKVIKDEIDVFASFVNPKHRRFDLAAVSAVEIWLCEGDDHGNVHQSIEVDAVIHGGEDDDMLWGGSGDDFIEGGDGNDKIWGRNGDDELHGDDGDDRMTGGKGTDILDGGPGNNILKP